jgi:hypothetical protein
MELVLQIFPYANAEIVAAAGSFGMTLFGLSFALLKKFRVNKKSFNNNIFNIIIK